MIKRSQIELLAPAGDEECFKAAIAAGADAVYFGLEQFSARTRAKNITVNQAKYLIPLAHKHNCRAYLTLNTLITDDEMQTALELVAKAVDCGVDGIIVQDLGVLKAIRTCFPDLEIHASTQMTTHNLSQCKFLSELGVSQVNLSRELSLSEIQTVTKFLHSKNIVPEIFVQGAFCISYSGQCYLSGHLYGEAGNRGSCVQPCRRKWAVCPENQKDLTDYKALFHLKDNSAYSLADKLIEENVPLSLKIEGRIKNAEYVWAVTSAWREQIDLILANKPIQKSSPKLTGAINRDYTCGYLEGNISGQMFSSGEKDISQIKAGTVKNYIADSKTLILQNVEKLNTGDRLTIKTASDQFICTATVKDKNSSGYVIQITNKLTKKILSGQVVYKSSSVITPEELSKILNKISPENKKSENCAAGTEIQWEVDISVKAVENNPVEVIYACGDQKVSVKSEQILVKAQNAGLTSDTLQQKLTKLGGTCFTAKSFNVEILEPNLFIPLGELNNLRRKAIELLEIKLKDNPQQKENSVSLNTDDLLPSDENKIPVTESVEAFLIDTPKALDQLLMEKTVSKKNYKIIYELPSAINLVDKNLFDLLNENKFVVLYFNSILMDKDLEMALVLLNRFDNIAEREILCENTGLAYELKNMGCKIILGPNCNVYNSWNVQEYNQNLNLHGIIPSLELSPETVSPLKIPEKLQIWYPKKMHTLLMQSRQCLVRNGSGCRKGCVDRMCLENCSRKLALIGTQKEKIMAVKRPGFYSALYTSSTDSNLSSCDEKLRNKVSVWIIDKRF